MQYNYKKIGTPVGPLHIVSNGKKLVAVVFDTNWKRFSAAAKIILNRHTDTVISEVESQLKEYFSYKRTKFDVPIEYAGTDFQNQAWKTLKTIPFGKTISYGDQAVKMNNPKAVRAVGGANGKNRICIIIPCHRVVGKNGGLTGFTGGIKIKEFLLSFESRAMSGTVENRN